ncbi:MAG: polysaccharide deacetylase family protein [candidate division KSB1 bacterium]|nr:polysaccharide deacetylase family protein [candidate division KSB1 bacterium]MDQ7066356.1 polysaccharide deacetylase family protein [candidate division KSB1 bacterium]
MTAVIKHAFYGALRHGRIYHIARQKHKQDVLILTYHGVLKNGSNAYVNRNCVSAEMFEQQMRWLKQYYTVLPLSEIVDAFRNRKPLPEYTAAVTFDDGFRNNFTVAFPIMVRHNIPATIFLTTDMIGQPGARLWTEHVDTIIFSANVRRLQVQMNGTLTEFDVSNQQAKIEASDRIRVFLKTLNPGERARHILALERQVDRSFNFLDDDESKERYEFLNWDEVRLMSEHQVEFGSHTRTHSIIAHLSPAELEKELFESKQKIEQELQRPCRFFSYPNGTARDFSRRDQTMLREAGYEAALSQIYGFNTADTDRYALRRINIVRSPSFSYFQAKVTGVWGDIKKLAEKVPEF